MSRSERAAQCDLKWSGVPSACEGSECTWRERLSDDYTYKRTYKRIPATFISDTLSKPITVVNKFPVGSAFTSIIIHTLGTNERAHTHTQTLTLGQHSSVRTTFASKNTNAKTFNPSTIKTHATQ